jgi:hypothetical protein
VNFQYIYIYIYIYKKIFGTKRGEVVKVRRKQHDEKIHSLYSFCLGLFVWCIIKNRACQPFTGHGRNRNVYKDLVGNFEEKITHVDW